MYTKAYLHVLPAFNTIYTVFQWSAGNVCTSDTILMWSCNVSKPRYGVEMLSARATSQQQAFLWSVLHYCLSFVRVLHVTQHVKTIFFPAVHLNHCGHNRTWDAMCVFFFFHLVLLHLLKSSKIQNPGYDPCTCDVSGSEADKILSSGAEEVFVFPACFE